MWSTTIDPGFTLLSTARTIGTADVAPGSPPTTSPWITVT
jgi:hypothetical protein